MRAIMFLTIIFLLPNSICSQDSPIKLFNKNTGAVENN